MSKGIIAYAEKSKIKMLIDSLNHEGTGDFAASKLDLDTQSSAKISLDLDKVNYMKNIKLIVNKTFLKNI